MAEIKLQIYWSDCDAAGIFYFGNFFRLMERAEEEIFLQAAKPRQQMMDYYGVWFPRVEAHANFVSPIRNGSAVLVRMAPQFKGQKTVRFDFEVVDYETRRQLANGYMTAVCVDRVAFKSTPIPQEIVDLLSGPPTQT